MKSTELRIGNLFIEKYSGQIIKVIGLNEKTITFEGKFKNEWQAEPIPLTEEWLLKFGFSYVSNKNGHLYYINENGFTLLYSYNRWHFSPSPSVTIGKNIEYVHQLQNLFYCLTGEELTL